MIWIEGGLAWIPFLMQRLDHEYMLRSSEYPLLKKKPSDYMRDMYYASQPMEAENMRALACTFEMINAETQLLYASDYPHWDFDLPSRIWDLPFLSEKAKHNILGGTAARLFKLPPRNEQAEGRTSRASATPRRDAWTHAFLARCAHSPLLRERGGVRGSLGKPRDGNPSPHPSPYGRGSGPRSRHHRCYQSLAAVAYHCVAVRGVVLPPLRSPSTRSKISTGAGRSI